MFAIARVDAESAVSNANGAGRHPGRNAPPVRAPDSSCFGRSLSSPAVSSLLRGRSVAAFLLVCAAFPVSVSVRPERFACRDLQGTRDTTPDLCRAFCCLPRLHPFLASMALSCWMSVHRDEPLTQDSEGRPLLSFRGAALH